MVYCSRCGTQTPNNATNCSNCGAPLAQPETESRPYSRHEYRHYYDDRSPHHNQHGSGIGLFIAGIFIIIIGIVVLTGFVAFWLFFWPLVLVLIGIWILLLGLRRSRRYRQPPPP
ncbi:MAG: zinc-ribbon domain-containing protein [Candidatus Bathyarchaeia archaeon]